MAESSTAPLDRAVAQIAVLTGNLARRARLDIEGAVLSAASYEAPVSSSGGLTPTEAGVEALTKAADYNRVVRKLSHVARILDDLWAELTPTATGETCPTTALDSNGQTVNCHGNATHRNSRGLRVCHNCHRHDRAGQPPPDAKLLREWNARTERDCNCGSPRCRHEPGACLNRVKPNEGATCDGCRHRRDDSSDGTHPWTWQQPA